MLGRADPVHVATAPNEAVALMWRELLAAEGIPVLLRVAGPGMADFATALCEHHVYARADQAARARQLLDDYSATPDAIVPPDGSNEQ